MRTIRNEIGLDGINQFTTPTITDNPETTYRVYGNIDKKIHKFRLSFNANLSWFNYTQTVNSQTVINDRNNQNFGLRLRTANKNGQV